MAFLSRSRRVWLASFGILAGLAIAVATAAAVGDRSPPSVTLHHGDDRQYGEPWTATWTTSSGHDLCSTLIADGIPAIDPAAMDAALHVGTGLHELRFRFHTSKRPYKRIGISAWTAIDADGLPVGPSHRLPYRLVSERSHGHTRWAALIRPIVSSDLYLNVSARWKDEGPCGGVDRSSWVFHVAP